MSRLDCLICVSTQFSYIVLLSNIFETTVIQKLCLLALVILPKIYTLWNRSPKKKLFLMDNAPEISPFCVVIVATLQSNINFIQFFCSSKLQFTSDNSFHTICPIYADFFKEGLNPNQIFGVILELRAS